MLAEKVEKAFQQIEAGLIHEGLACLQELLERPDMDDELKFEAAQMYYQYGFLDKALELMQELYAHYEDEPEICLTLAELYLENSESEKALELLEKFTPDEGDDYLRAILLLSELYVIDGLFEVAENKLKQALELFPGEQVLFTALGEVFYIQEKYSLAVLNFEKGSVISTYAKLADCYAHLGNFELALDYYKKATTTDKENAELLFGYGFVAYHLEDFDLAIRKFKALLNLDPFYTSAYPLIAEALGKTGDLAEAVKYIEEGIKYDQTNPYLLYLKGQLLRKQGDRSGSIEWLQNALELDGSESLALEELLDIYEEQEDWQRALSTIEKLLEMAPERVDLYIKRGQFFEELEQWADAEAAYRQALELDPESTLALNQLGYLLRDEGRLAEALEVWKSSLSLDPEQEDIEQAVEQDQV